MFELSRLFNCRRSSLDISPGVVRSRRTLDDSGCLDQGTGETCASPQLITSLAYNADISPGTNYCSGISLSGLAAGTYYVRTSALTFWCAGCTYRYRLLLDVH